ncbi:MAG TPA: hypothetical protein VHH15_11410 [Actinophytocola sp.]|nr:hypothetical protein [Actinophytocola sp.]
MDELVGEWSSAASGLHHSVFEDESYSFLAGGDGWYQFSRPDYADLAYFRWRRTDIPGEIELTWEAAREIFGGVVTEQHPDPEPTRLTYRVGEEDTPLGGPTVLLRLHPVVGFAREFGLVSRTPVPVAKGDLR